MSAATQIPDAYDGREQALVKHCLLEAYLQKLFLIVGMSAKTTGKTDLCYVDCFAGPWGDPSVGMEATSIAISLRTLEACRQELENHGITAKIKALYVEEDPKAFDRLKAYLGSATPPHISADCFHGDFVALRQEILDWVGESSFSFFFIDPKGWAPVGVPTLSLLLQRPRSEFLVNFMYNDVNRMASMREWQPDFATLLGEAVDLSGLAPDKRERAIVRTYRKNLKRQMPPGRHAYGARAVHVRVLDPNKERPKYHLVYLTSHPRGIVEFMKISEGVDLVQKQVRAIKKDAKKTLKTGTPDMWGSDSLVDPVAGHASPEDVDEFWCDYLRDGPRQIDQGGFADILERTDWFPSDLQLSLVRLIKSGTVANLTADIVRRHKRPLHFEAKGGEKIGLVRP